jgi:homoserine O-acetyltransferase
VPVLYMPGATDLYFPMSDAEYERKFLTRRRSCRFRRCGGTRRAGAAIPTDAAFINKQIAAFLK